MQSDLSLLLSGKRQRPGVEELPSRTGLAVNATRLNYLFAASERIGSSEDDPTSFADAFDLLIDLRIFGAYFGIARAIWTAGGHSAVDLPAAGAARSIAGRSNGDRTSRSGSVA
jgi:hypothetical protein